MREEQKQAERRQLLAPALRALRNLCRQLEVTRQGAARHPDPYRAQVEGLVTRALEHLTAETHYLERSELTSLAAFMGADPASALSILARTHRRVQSAIALCTSLASLHGHSDPAQEVTSIMLDAVANEDIRLEFPDSRTKFPVEQLLALATTERGAVVAHLLRALAVPNQMPQVIVFAIIALGHIGDASASPALRAVLRSFRRETWGTVIPSAACALVAIGDPHAIPEVFDAIQEELNTGNYAHWTARAFIAEALPRLLRDDDLAYGHASKRWAEEKQRYDPDFDDERRTHGYRAAPALAQILETSLLNSGRREAVEIAANYAASRDRNRALAGTEVLRKIDTDESTGALVAILGKRRQYIASYEQVHDIDGNFPSEYAWNDEQRLLAANALASRPSSAARHALCCAANDPESGIGDQLRLLLRDESA